MEHNPDIIIISERLTFDFLLFDVNKFTVIYVSFRIVNVANQFLPDIKKTLNCKSDR
jgi:hypothetical protein